MRQFNPRQDEAEFAWFVAILKRNNVRSYLEIGSRFGGTLWWVASELPKNSLLVSVDRPSDDEGRASLHSCVNLIRKEFGHTVILIENDSNSIETVERVLKWSPFDALFIDGDHLLDAVVLDYNMYGPMAKIVALHDVGPSNIEGVDVPELWSHLCKYYETMHKISEGSHKGIGVIGTW